MTALPQRARVVVVGGGAIGTSVAYHLALEGERDVLLLERDRLTSGTTWHAAGLMTTFGSLSETSTAMRLYSRELYARLESETGLSTGFRPVGLVEAAAEPERLEEYRRVAAFQRLHGLEVEEIGPAEMSDLFPLARTDDLLAGFHVPGDGRVNPVDLTMSLARGARQRGVRIVEGVSVTGIRTVPSGAVRRVTGVTTSAGDVECEVVVACAGMWTRELMAGLGVVVPNQAAEHYYLITDTIDGVDPDGPIFEDPASYGYYREEGGGLMVGLFEPRAAPWSLDGIPATSSFRTLPPDWDRMAPYLDKAMDRVPVTHDVGIRTFFCGPESFTPDLQPIVGESPGVAGCFVVAGLNSVGILSAGGLGRIVAHWVSTGSPDVDVTGFAATRTRPEQAGRAFRAARTTEILGTVYAAHPPGVELTSARGVRRSPLHTALSLQGARFRDVSGWESPDWYAGPGATPSLTPSWGRAPWFAHWEAEHRAVREAVGLVDMSFMAKLWVTGPDAGAVLSRVSAGDVDGECGRITYTQWLDESARIRADLTVTKLEPDRFLVVASDTAHGSSLDWLERSIGDSRVEVFDGTSGLAQLNVHGPLARSLLSTVTSADLSDGAFPFRAARWIDVGFARALAVRITYVGELGWELYVPTEMAAHVHETLVAAGERFGLRHVGLRALGSLRLEKGYRDYGHDIDNTDDVVSAGLGFAVAMDKPGGFVGREAVAALRKAGPPPRRLVQVLLADPEPLLFHAEPVLRDGVPVGYVRAGSYGWTLGSAVGLAMVGTPDGSPATKGWFDAGTWEVDVAGRRVPATVSLRSLYDPTNARIRG
ncbi:FAD dependent oxidoreductase [Nostocoides japonicum T1-X7]|uniref:FAD dependent oxidoreductase n=1 Tax=Nostocoides japonicum T1-X7 TaxID=1194083 RepID=A0A077LYM5_9MICO|nr:FAD-dependent oxidoreductase [Tetrasphaera japonica]CCH77075.1 FAD dependent oxidoreductase [Tetrasphaera japonica T1-X7]